MLLHDKEKTMTKLRWTSRSLLLLAPAVGAGAVLAGAPAANAQPRTEPVTVWAGQNAEPLRTVDPSAPLDDQAPVRRSIGNATVVGLGESVHGAAEETLLKHRTLRLLVERMGFRSVAWEENWTTGLRIDRYIRTGQGDLDAIMRDMLPQYQTREVADVLRWLRGFNTGRSDKVRFVGVEYFLTGPAEYEAVKSYVAATAPERLPELQRHLDVVEPRIADMWEWAAFYGAADDKDRYIRHAHRLYELVEGLPHRKGDRAHALALHNARQIVSFYEHYSLPETDQHSYRDAHAAGNLKWWRRYSGDKIAYWAASPHTAVAPRLRIVGPDPEMRFASAGTYLRRWYGTGYRSIGFTFDHGKVSVGEGNPAVDMPRPAPDWFERPFGGVRTAQFVLDLRSPAPPPVRRWLDAPIRTRGLAHTGPGSYMSGGTLRQWYDVVVHRQEVSPARPA
ncbi:erythromycin esterase family protein [Actinomadura darangshiensis]|uniref:Erythromycin esterase family protein n=1 Tax=Actinomadura darangshiensis TaxID=705336 RepID=A0A4V2YW73_9ACTN|nr:erythromycin esterase family protein [Actinomadura darangshiensis]TDD84287.1 erythromycin esterase family protein [Actinomadura darangshiensis]